MSNTSIFYFVSMIFRNVPKSTDHTLYDSVVKEMLIENYTTAINLYSQFRNLTFDNLDFTFCRSQCFEHDWKYVCRFDKVKL